MKGHPRLIGRSTIADGTLKFDYLVQTTISVLGVTVPVVVKVGPDQQALLGLDVMWSLNLNLFTTDLTYEITPTASPRVGFRFLDFSGLMQREGLTENDLVPVASLPPPKEAYKAMVDAGKTSSVVDLGTSCFSVVHTKPNPIIDLGTTCFSSQE